MYDAILVATDGSEPAGRAVDRALRLGAENNAVVHVISVVDTSRYGEPALSSAEIVLDELEDEAQDLLVEVTDRAASMDVETVTQVIHGEPHAEICDYAREVDADLILLGKYGRSRTGHHIGSVSSRVTNQADRSVHLT